MMEESGRSNAIVNEVRVALVSFDSVQLVRPLAPRPRQHPVAVWPLLENPGRAMHLQVCDSMIE